MRTLTTALFMASCATTASPEPARPPAQSTEVREATPEPIPYPPNPVLSLYVQGPDPDRGEYLESATPDDYHASLVVTNTGDAPVDIAKAEISFEIGLDGGRFIPCNDHGDEVIDRVETLEPHRAYTYAANVHCEFPGPGRYQIRAYVRFAAEAEHFDLERHYAGTYEVVVR